MTRLARLLWTLIMVAAIASPACVGQAAPPAAKDAGAADPVATRSATIKYGIESELLDLFKILQAEKEDRYDAEILALLEASGSAALRIAIFDLFRSRAWKGAEDSALRLVKGRDSLEPALVAAALAYLAEIRSKPALEFASTLLEENDKVILPPLVALLGRAGGDAEEGQLIAWIQGDAPTQQLREAAIRALGDIGSKKAAEALAKILVDSAAQRFDRIYAAEALGKIGEASSVAPLVKAANGDDPNVQAAAVEALGSFDGAVAETAIVEALRSSFAKSRIAACKALAKRRLASALPNLQYKATKDPDKSVKAEALRAIAAIGGKDAFAFILDALKDPKGEGSLRVLCFGLLARKDSLSSMDALLAILGDEAKTVDRVLYLALVREIGSASDAPGALPLARFLFADRDYLVRIGGLNWVRLARPDEVRSDLEALSEKDPNEAVRRLAKELLAPKP